jgi:hypothetical protein
VTYTGTILGLGGLLLIMSAMSTFQGDQEAAIAAVIGEEPIYAGSSCEMKSIDDFLVKSEQHWQAKYGASQLLSYDIHYYRDCNAVLGVHSEIPGYLATTNTLSYSLVTGELLREKDWIAGSVGDRWYALLAPLHFGHFAGYLGRWFYAVSAVALVALIISGLLLWVDKQQSEPSNNKFSYFYSHPLLKLSLAVVLSISATTYLMLLIAKITPALFTVFSPTLFYIASFLSLTALTYLLPKQLKLYLAMLALLSLTLMFSDVVNSANSAWLNGVNISLLGFAAFFVLALVKVKRLETA